MIREKLIAFFRAEIDAEEQWGFPRLNRIPEHFLQSPEPLPRTERRGEGALQGLLCHFCLRGHLKSGQWWSLQNRPTECGLGLGCFTPTPPVEASLFSYANSVDHI
jgi:hypothetical protein